VTSVGTVRTGGQGFLEVTDETSSREVEALLAQLPDGGAVRREGDEPAFDSAWELRAFALAVAAHQSGQYDWGRFQHSLIEAIKRWEAAPEQGEWRYYDRWLEALESILVTSGAIAAADLEERTCAVLDVPREANHHQAHREPVTIDPGRW
jgi:nitrile hydratase accessory protein